MQNPIGVFALGAFGGIEIYEVDSYDDFVSYRYLNADGSRSRLVRSKIRFDRRDRPYFRAMNSRIFLDEVVRIGSPWIGNTSVPAVA